MSDDQQPSHVNHQPPSPPNALPPQLTKASRILDQPYLDNDPGDEHIERSNN